MQKQPDRLTIFALYVMEDLAADAYKQIGPMKRTWSTRLALAYLNRQGLISKEVAANIWEGLVRPSCDHSDATWAYCRYRDLNRYVESMFKDAGIYRGGPGRREIGDVAHVRPLVPAPPDRTTYVPPPPKPPWEPEKPLTDEEWHARKAFMDATRGNSIQTRHPRYARKKGTTVKDGSR